jgi:hypothetical protein|tara:strand:+ start:70 stop:528 length:459 start_codon:yes stop_codon:yes gene_type:complete
MSDADTRAYNRNITNKVSFNTLNRLHEAKNSLYYLATKSEDESGYKTTARGLVEDALKAVKKAEESLRLAHDAEFDNDRDNEYKAPRREDPKRGDRVYYKYQDGRDIGSGYYTIVSIRKKQLKYHLGTAIVVTIEDDSDTREEVRLVDLVKA